MAISVGQINKSVWEESRVCCGGARGAIPGLLPLRSSWGGYLSVSSPSISSAPALPSSDCSVVHPHTLVQQLLTLYTQTRVSWDITRSHLCDEEQHGIQTVLLKAYQRDVNWWMRTQTSVPLYLLVQKPWHVQASHSPPIQGSLTQEGWGSCT